MTQIEMFLEFLAVEKCASPNTIAAYKNDLTQFQTGVAVSDLGSVTPGEVSTYIDQLGQRGYKEATVARKGAAIRSFYGYLIAAGFLTDDPSELVTLPRVTKEPPRILTDTEIERILSVLNIGQTAEKRRDLAMFLILRHCGLRVTQLVGLDVEDIDLNGEPISLKVSEGNPLGRYPGTEVSTREIVIPTEALEELRAYIFYARTRLVRNRQESALFVNRRGERLTRQGFWLILRETGKKAGVAGKVTPHSLRHTCADRLVQGGKPLTTVQALLGHASISTTQMYRQPQLASV